MLISTTPLPAFGASASETVRRGSVGGCSACQRAMVGEAEKEKSTLSELGVVLLVGAAVLFTIAII